MGRPPLMPWHCIKDTGMLIKWQSIPLFSQPIINKLLGLRKTHIYIYLRHLTSCFRDETVQLIKEPEWTSKLTRSRKGCSSYFLPVVTFFKNNIFHFTRIAFTLSLHALGQSFSKVSCYRDRCTRGTFRAIFKNLQLSWYFSPGKVKGKQSLSKQ